MENASKALLIAGGILISIIIISMFLSMYNRMSSIQKEEAEEKRMEAILKFNAEYEAFDKKIMYGTDVITLANKIENNNTNNLNNNLYQIELYLNDKKVVNGTKLKESDKDFEKKMFKCVAIDYNETGRISIIKIANY